MLSPLLFNIYLNDALKSSPVLQQILRRGDLFAYADDIVLHLSSIAEVRGVIEAFEDLSVEWGIVLNKNKS